MLDPEAILRAADREVEAANRYTAGPSYDVAIAAAIRATCAAVNTYVRDVAMQILTVLTYAHDDVDPQAFNAAVAQVAQTFGIQPPAAAPPASGPGYAPGT